MKTIFSEVPGFIKKHKIVSILLGIILVGLLWWSAVNLTPRPLGTKMEYLGKKDYGGGLFYSDYKPYSVYYYGTNAHENEIVDLFNKSADENTSEVIGDGYSGATITFGLGESESFHITYYEGTKAFNGDARGYSNIISVMDEDYPKAKKYLK